MNFLKMKHYSLVASLALLSGAATDTVTYPNNISGLVCRNEEGNTARLSRSNHRNLVLDCGGGDDDPDAGKAELEFIVPIEDTPVTKVTIELKACFTVDDRYAKVLWSASWDITPLGDVILDFTGKVAGGALSDENLYTGCGIFLDMSPTRYEVKCESEVGSWEFGAKNKKLDD